MLLFFLFVVAWRLQLIFKSSIVRCLEGFQPLPFALVRVISGSVRRLKIFVLEFLLPYGLVLISLTWKYVVFVDNLLESLIIINTHIVLTACVLVAKVLHDWHDFFEVEIEMIEFLYGYMFANFLVGTRLELLGKPSHGSSAIMQSEILNVIVAELALHSILRFRFEHVADIHEAENDEYFIGFGPFLNKNMLKWCDAIIVLQFLRCAFAPANKSSIH